jgi:VanZ family protein
MDRRRRTLAGGIALLIYGFIFLMSSLPASSLPSGIPDVIPHVAEFALLAFFFVQAFAAPCRWPTLAAAFLLLALLGLLDEWHQLSTPGRFFSLRDWLHDVIGALAGMAAYLALSRQRSVKSD